MIGKLIVGVTMLLAQCAPPVNVPDKDRWGIWESTTTGARVQTPPAGIQLWEVIYGWNWAAGRTLFVGDDVNPQIVFQGDMPVNHERDAWVERIEPGGQFTTKCIIHYDPTVIGTWVLNGEVLAHEIGHCLGFSPDGGADQYNDEYQGIMSYDLFWTDRSSWFQAEDQRMLKEAGLGIR